MSDAFLEVVQAAELAIKVAHIRHLDRNALVATAGRTVNQIG
ncbi:hypothetical protein M2232_003048 [Bradyrhizobium japonicum]|nr:hypothetical protein [Bradyrhizobium japonicum]MCW2219516.1 hypothetical protein [Bradyrhizobium japonicum]MCW2344130.1 hypothetical protein [Bradyrhizobium japonicum]